MLHTVIVQQIAGIERLPPRVIRLTTDVRVFISFELFTHHLLGPLIGFALIRANLFSVPYGSNVILILYGDAVKDITDARNKQFHRDAVEENMTVREACNRLLLSLDDVHSDTRLLQQLEGTCELVLALFPLTMCHLIAMNIIGHIRAFTNHKLSVLLSDQMDMGIVIGV